MDVDGTMKKVDLYVPTVYYGMLYDNLPWKATKCRTTTYTNEEYHHTCLMDNTKNGMKYYYQIKYGNNPEYSSKIYYFTTPVAYSKTQRSLILGDLGWVNGQNTADVLKLWTNQDNRDPGIPLISHIHHVGDIAYSDDAHRGEENPDFEPINNLFAEMIQPIAAYVPYMVLPGNHDVSMSLTRPDDKLPEWGRNFTHYQHRWANAI
eukprot:UN08132